MRNKMPKRPPTKEELAVMAAQAAKNLPPKGTPENPMGIDVDLIKKHGEKMLCMGKIPLFDKETGKPIDGKFQRCNGEFFVNAHKLMYLSPIVSPAGTQTITNLIMGKMCAKCGRLFNPDEWVAERIKEKETVKGTVLDKKGG